MKLINETDTAYTFQMDNGTTWTREKMTWASRSVELRGWKHARNLYIPSVKTLDFFPDAEYCLQLTSDREQTDPLFVSVPVRIKPGTKTVLQIFNDDLTVDEYRIKKFFQW